MSFLVLKAYLKLIHFDLYMARGNFAALYDKVRNYPVGTRTPAPDAHRRYLLGCRHRLHLVLEGSALPAALRRHRLPPEKARRAGADGHRRAANALQGSRMGGSGWPRRQRQTVHAGNICSARQVLRLQRSAKTGSES